MTIGIVGLGLMGGSMAKAIKQRTSHDVLGADLDTDTLMMARISGAIDNTLNEKNLGSCQLIFLAVRPGAAVEWLHQHAQHIAKEATVVDFCGVKRAVVDTMAQEAQKYGFSYIGGHPMAGSERNGFTSASGDLYQGASMILTPDEQTDITLLERLKAFFLDVGFANLTFSTPEEHDRIIAYTSQLAHIASSAYIKSPEAQRRRGFSAGSFQDMTRVARLDETMWTELLLADRDFLIQEMEIYLANLQEYLEALRSNDAIAMEALLRDGREKKASAGGN